MSTVLVSSLFVGLVFGLLAMGLVIGYRGSRVVNFAHGDIGMIAAMVFTDLRFGQQAGLVSTDRGLVWTLPLAIAVAAAIGALTELFVVRPLRHAPRIQPLVGTFAVSAILLVFADRRWSDSIRYTEPLVAGDGVRIGGLQVSAHQLVILVVTLTMLVGLTALYRYTRFGLRLRATAVDPYAAGLSGVDVNRTSLVSWALAGAVAGLSGILVAPLVAFNILFMVSLMIRALAAALVGGLTNLWGALAAGVILAVVEGVVAFKSPIAGVGDLLVAGFVLVLMLVRPSGLLKAAY